MSEDKEEREASFDRFELFIAFLLGLGALGATWAAFQADLWGGVYEEGLARSNIAYSRAAERTGASARAMAQTVGMVQNATSSTTFTVQIAQRDLTVFSDAQRELLAARRASGAERAGHLELARFMLAHQMTPQMQKAIGYPAGALAKWADLPEEQLTRMLNALPEDFWAKRLTTPKEFTEASRLEKESLAAMEEAKQALVDAETELAAAAAPGATSDALGITGVLFAAALFLSGIALVFKSRVRWVFGVVGLVAVTIAGVHLFLQPWTSV